MTGAPDVDVVVATRDRPGLLAEAVDAVRAQRYPGRVTTIVVFDQSTPDDALRRSSVDRPLVVVANDRAPGLAGARNRGILAGEAPLVAFCDDDDLWHPDKLAHQVPALLSGDALCCVTGIEVAYRDGTTVRVPRPEELSLRSLVRNRVMAAHPSTVLVRRDGLLGAIGLVDEEIPGSYGEDYDWILRAAAAGPIALVAEPLTRVRWGGSQFSTQWSTIIAAIDYGLDKHPAFHDDRRALARLQGRKAFAMAALGDPGTLRQAWRAVRTHPLERRGYLAAAVGLGLVDAEQLLDLAHRRGRGI